ncbi:MAG: CBS domain-containing protein [Saprospiraceae bacterium]|nr:CBS domain-containing protein [Saprospiraceae bacterium]
MDTDPLTEQAEHFFSSATGVPGTILLTFGCFFFLLQAYIYFSEARIQAASGWMNTIKFFRTLLRNKDSRRASRNASLYFARVSMMLVYVCFFFLIQTVFFQKDIIHAYHIFYNAPSWICTLLIVIVLEAVMPLLELNITQSTHQKYAHIFRWLFLPLFPVIYIQIKWFTGEASVVQSQENSDKSFLLQTTSSFEGDQEVDHDDDVNLQDVRDLRFITARQIMCPRMDISAISDSWKFEEVLAYIKTTGYSRFPVFHGELDTISGILVVKDILPLALGQDNHDWTKLIREDILFVPESIRVDMLLREFQNNRQHMAIIVDEYGGTSGIATLEDVMEELVGEIKDEFDGEDEQVFLKIKDNQFLFDGKTLIQDVCRIAGISSGFFDTFRKEADSLGGLLVEASGNLPVIGRVFQFGNIVLSVENVNKNRIERIKLEIVHHEND